MQGKLNIIVSLLIIMLITLFSRCNRGEKYAITMEKIAAKACVCKSKQCSKKLLKEFNSFFFEMKKKNAKANHKNTKRIEKALKKTQVCLVKNGLSINEIYNFIKKNNRK